MDGSPLINFFRVIKDDNRISVAHISLYMALLVKFHANGFVEPVMFRRVEIMETAKINGLATYHKCIKDLAAFGYIQYVPSYNPAKLNLVYLSQIFDKA